MNCFSVTEYVARWLEHQAIKMDFVRFEGSIPLDAIILFYFVFVRILKLYIVYNNRIVLLQNCIKKLSYIF